MADIVFNVALGAVAEKVRDSSTALILLLLKAVEADDALRDHDDVAAMLLAAGNTEADFTSYGRKTGLTGTVTVDDVNNRVDVDLADQTFAAATTGQSIVKAVVAIEESASDAGRIPLTGHDFTVTTDGSDITAQVNANGFYRAS